MIGCYYPTEHIHKRLHFAEHFMTDCRISLCKVHLQQLTHSLIVPESIVPRIPWTELDIQHGVGGWAHVPGNHVQWFFHPYSSPVTVSWYFFNFQIKPDFLQIVLHQQARVSNTSRNLCQKEFRGSDS